MVFIMWCTGLPVATNYISENSVFLSDNAISEAESIEVEKTQESIFENSYTSTFEETSVAEQAESIIETEPVNTVRVYNYKTEEIIVMELEEYIVGTVYAEMPSSFEPEALKAQAIAVRSYIVHNILYGDRESGHPGADICTNPAHCIAYTTIDEVIEKYGEVFAEESFNIIRQAVEETKDLIMTYDGEVINSVFHASSCGFTESCADVWGGDLPYLVSVSTPDESSFYSYYGKMTFTADEFKSKFASYQCDFSGSIYNWIKNIETNSIGRCESVDVGGVTISGNTLRELFGLKSTKIKITINFDNIIFETEGYGHGVGMSQYGANVMAEAGKTYEEILKHYYTDVELEEISLEWFK